MIQLLRIAFRNVLRNRRRSLITFGAVFLALTIMVTIRGFLNGMQATVRESVVLGMTGALQVHRAGFLKSVNANLSLDVPADDGFLQRITSVKGVKAAAARIAFGGMVNAHDTNGVALLQALDPVREPQVCPRRNDGLHRGRQLAEAGPASAVFTPELASSVGVDLGQRATLLTNDRDGVMNAVDVDLVGIYGQAGLPLPDKKRGFVPLALAQELLRMPGRATEIAVAVNHLDDVPAIKQAVQQTVGPEYEVSSWHDVASWVDEAIAAQNFVLNLLALIFLVVALLGIVNTMLMSVYERTREIGTMMSLGVRRRQILALFLLEAALLGLSGGLFGSAAGGALVLYMGHHGIRIMAGNMTAPLFIYPFVELHYLSFILVLASGGAALAALWPALRASRLRPVEALASV